MQKKETKEDFTVLLQALEVCKSLEILEVWHSLELRALYLALGAESPNSMTTITITLKALNKNCSQLCKNGYLVVRLSPGYDCRNCFIPPQSSKRPVINPTLN